MTAGEHSGAGGGEAFAALDPKLTVFALANGTDLSKGEGYRRLEWFTDGRERAILIEPDAASTFRITVLSWKTGDAENRTEAIIVEGLGADQIGASLAEAIGSANDL